MSITEAKNKLLIFTNGLRIKRYKLDREISNVKYKVYTIYPTITNDYNIDEIKDHMNEILLKYYETVVKTFPSNYLNTFYKNIATIKYKEGLDTKEILSSLWGLVRDIGTTEAYYCGYDNTINVISRKQKTFLVLLSRDENESYDDIIKNTLSHEILHAATYMTDDNVTYYGFYQNSGTYDVGMGINEGYTELLARRYFEKETGYYDDEVIMAHLIEDIISKSKMEHLYFFSDLKGLMTELTKYADKKAVNRFILDFDSYCARPNDKSLRAAIDFIKEAHKNKILLDKSITNKDEVINKYNEKIESSIIKKH